MNINIQDSLQQLKEAVEELEALRTVIAMAEDHPVDRETLIVTRTALEPILKDLREVTEAIREELKIE